MEQSLITVKYIGKWDSMTCDYNHKRYCFRSKERISTIPTEVYDFIKQARDVLSMELIPYQEQNQPDTTGLPETANNVDFVPIPLKDYAKLSKVEKKEYRTRKAESEKSKGELQ